MTSPSSTDRRSPTDLTAQRHRSPYALRVQIGRVLWTCCQATLFRFSPRPAYRWRRWLLRMFGADIHPSARVHSTVRVEQPWNVTLGPNATIGDAAIVYALGTIKIGARATISQFSYLCAGSHNYHSVDMPLTRHPIVIGEDAWIAADGFVGPGVTVGEGAILGARGVATQDLEPWTIYAGNPAVVIKSRPRLSHAEHHPTSNAECEAMNADQASGTLGLFPPLSEESES